MLLAIDIGNTTITLGLHERDALGPRWRLATDHSRMADEYGITMVQLFQHAGVTVDRIDGIAIGSVVPSLTDTLEHACRKYIGPEPFTVDVGVKTGVRLRYDDPKQVGADRVLDAAAALRL